MLAQLAAAVLVDEEVAQCAVQQGAHVLHGIGGQPKMESNRKGRPVYRR